MSKFKISIITFIISLVLGVVFLVFLNLQPKNGFIKTSITNQSNKTNNQISNFPKNSLNISQSQQTSTSNKSSTSNINSNTTYSKQSESEIYLINDRVPKITDKGISFVPDAKQANLTRLNIDNNELYLVLNNQISSDISNQFKITSDSILKFNNYIEEGVPTGKKFLSVYLRQDDNLVLLSDQIYKLYEVEDLNKNKYIMYIIEGDEEFEIYFSDLDFKNLKKLEYKQPIHEIQRDESNNKIFVLKVDTGGSLFNVLFNVSEYLTKR